MTFPENAFILAAGRGTRLRPYTDSRPKPMVEVAGRTLIDRALDRLEEAGIRRVVVNTHYCADIIESHLSRRPSPQIAISREETLLDTGGGIRHAMEKYDFLKQGPFYVIASDALWTDGSSGSALHRLARAWNNDEMDIITLLQPLAAMKLTTGAGDYDCSRDGRPVRSHDKTGPYMWTNIRINHPRLFDNAPDGPFSFLPLMDEAERKGRFRALIHDGDWHHISTPEDLEKVDAAFRAERKTA